MDGVVAVLVGLVLGVPVGSFLNVVIDRVPDRVPLRGPRDGEPIAPVAWLGLPAQPWLLRLGRGPEGTLPRPWLAVEVVTAVLFAVFAARYGESSIVALLALWVLVAALVAVSVVDLRLLRIPDRITFPALALSVPLVVVASVQEVGRGPIVSALAGAAIYFLLLLIPHLVYPAGMGFGDVKLALLMGLFLGWLGWTDDQPILGPVRLILDALILGCVLGIVFGLVAQVVTKRRGAFPFGPALALACLVVLYFAPDLRA